MAKRRLLKRDISYVAGDLVTEVLVLAQLVPGVDQEKAEALVNRIADLHDEYIKRAHQPAGKDNKKAVKEYYRALVTDLQQEIDTIEKEIEGLSKDKVAE
ncbi:MAG: hypothetical protein LUH10_16865 [Tannerellaceae bacterium]|nr:hypothetical protein [Tannerellaceae bacterium]